MNHWKLNGFFETHCEKSRVRKLNASDVYEIRRRYDSGERRDSIASDFRIAPNTVSQIGKRRRWPRLPETPSPGA